MPNDEHYRRLERMYLRAAINEYFRPSARIGDGTCEVIIPARADFFHAARAVHGAVYFKALDDAAFFAANSIVEDVFVLTVTFSVQLLRPISEGLLISRAQVVHRSKRLVGADAVVTDEKGRQLARGSGTFMRSEIALGPEIGYA